MANFREGDSNLWPILEVGFELIVNFRGGDSNL